MILCGIALFFHSLLMVPCGSKHAGMLIVILYYKYLKNNSAHFIGSECRELVLDNARKEKYKIYGFVLFLHTWTRNNSRKVHPTFIKRYAGQLYLKLFSHFKFRLYWTILTTFQHGRNLHPILCQSLALSSQILVETKVAENRKEKHFISKKHVQHVLMLFFFYFQAKWKNVQGYA